MANPDHQKTAVYTGPSDKSCPICLEDFEDRAFVNACFHILAYGSCHDLLKRKLMYCSWAFNIAKYMPIVMNAYTALPLTRLTHSFCFFCILQWSEVGNTCPLCKTAYTSLIHKVKANDDYEKVEMSIRERLKRNAFYMRLYRLMLVRY